MKEFLAWTITGMAIIGFLGLVIIGCKWFESKTANIAKSWQVVEIEGHRYVIVTTEHGVAICAVTNQCHTLDDCARALYESLSQSVLNDDK